MWVAFWLEVGGWVQGFSGSCVCLALIWIVCFFGAAGRVDGDYRERAE